MSKSLLILILIFITKALYADECNQVSTLPSNLESIIQNLNGCVSDDFQGISESVEKVKVRNLALITEVQSLKNRIDSKKIKKSLNKILETMECISRKISEGLIFSCNGWRCKESKTVNGFINGGEHKSIFGSLKVIPHDSTVYVCTDNMRQTFQIHQSNYSNAESTIYHEISHHCGTVDHAIPNYRRSENKADFFSRPVEHWYNNSHHFGLWYDNDFFLP